MRIQDLPSTFGFLAEHDPLLLELASVAERTFPGDPNTTLIKLRKLGEDIAQHITAISGSEFDEQTTQASLRYRINRELRLEPVVRELFHALCIVDNKATHQYKTRHKEVLDDLKVARSLAIWLHKSFGKIGTHFKPGPFSSPADPGRQLRQLQTEIEKLKHDLQQANVQLDYSQQLNELIDKEKDEYETLALAMDEESQLKAQGALAHEQALTQQQKSTNRKSGRYNSSWQNRVKD